MNKLAIVSPSPCAIAPANPIPKHHIVYRSPSKSSQIQLPMPVINVKEISNPQHSNQSLETSFLALESRHDKPCILLKPGFLTEHVDLATFLTLQDISRRLHGDLPRHSPLFRLVFLDLMYWLQGGEQVLFTDFPRVFHGALMLLPGILVLVLT